MPGLWESSMHDEVTIAEITDLNTDGSKDIGPKETISCRYEPNGARTRNSDGEVVDEKDKFITHAEVTTSHLVWPPGADTSTTDEAHKPSEVKSAKTLDGDDGLYEVVI